MSADAAEPAVRRRTPLVVILVIVAGLALLLGANAHLVYVAFTSQPACVPHLKAGHSEDGYSAARSAC